MHPFEQFLQTFIPEVSQKAKQLCEAIWQLETTGSSCAADLRAKLDAEYRLLYHDKTIYEKLLEWDRDIEPSLKRQLNILIRAFKQNQIPKALLEEIVQKEAALAQSYANFRPEVEGKRLSENDINEVLKNENNPAVRQKVWEASKAIGDVLAPQILALVKLRNEAARSLGYADYFQMQLDLQEVDGQWLKKVFDALAERSEVAYLEVLQSIQVQQSKRFGVPVEKLGAWAWTEPFCQEDPLVQHDLDSLVNGIDITAAGREYYQSMGIDVRRILEQSDLLERPGKNQHAFCLNIDRGHDVRILGNFQSSIKWLETMLHELGHAVYELGIDQDLPWLLREPSHTMTTEAMALVAGRQAYRYEALCQLVGHSDAKEQQMRKADISLKRRQLIFSRWVLVVTFFESELYKNPHQDLNRLWWHMVEKYQKITTPQGRDGKNDWAAKYHIGQAPVYYFSYLLGEMFASALEETLEKKGWKHLASKEAGRFLQQKLFYPGNRVSFGPLVQDVTGQPFTSDAWIRQFA